MLQIEVDKFKQANASLSAELSTSQEECATCRDQLEDFHRQSKRHASAQLSLQQQQVDSVILMHVMKYVVHNIHGVVSFLFNFC